jgi:hypothetical protein
VGFVFLEPPCTSFSCAAHPAVRSYATPLGFDRLERRTLAGNVLALRCLAVLLSCLRAGVGALLEQPRLSKMR